jgi:hypothetical protein
LFKEIESPIARISDGVSCVVPFVFSLAASFDVHNIPQFDDEADEIGCAMPSCLALVSGIEI